MKECGDYVYVDFYISDANYSDTYHIDGQHYYATDEVLCHYRTPGPREGVFSDVTSESVDTPALNVTGVAFSLLQVDSPAIDTDPNAGDGHSLRIFPDDNINDNHAPGQGPDRATIRVTATLNEHLAGQTIYFRNFDLDDPTADTTIDPNGTAGDDNRGSPTPGRLNGSNGQATVTAITDANGAASVNFTVTMQPGDNFAIAASRNANQVEGVSVVGTNLIHGQQVLGVAACLPEASLCGTEMLTVWRRLHIERDSMGNVTNNKIVGATPISGRSITVNPGQTKTIAVTSTLEFNRFQNGRVVFGGGALFVGSNTTNALEATNEGSSAITIQAGALFYLYDDDDFNNEDGTLLIGDEGENIPMPPADLITANSDDPNNNILAPAYIRVLYDVGDSNDNTTFAANVSATGGAAIRSLFDFDQVATESNVDFWTAYLLGGYQYIIQQDHDPFTEDQTLGITDAQNGQGSILFFETGGVKDCFGTSFDCSLPATTAHEIGHLLNADHTDGGIMDQLSLAFSPTSIKKIRNVTHP